MIIEFWDFVRCKRPDGTYYGTSGKCRKGIEASAKEKEQDKKLLGYVMGVKETRAKVEKLKAAGLSDLEAAGVALWIDPYMYSSMNRSVLSEEDYPTRDVGEAGLRWATKGLAKLEPYNREVEPRFGENGKRLADPESPLKRGLKVTNEDLPSFLKEYEEAMSSGKPWVTNTLMGTTDLSFHSLVDSKEVSVVYEIRANKEGGGQGRAVDKFKNSAFEGEVLFAPGSKFKVVSIEKGGNTGKVDIKEIAATRYEDMPEFLLKEEYRGKKLPKDLNQRYDALDGDPEEESKLAQIKEEIMRSADLTKVRRAKELVSLATKEYLKGEDESLPPDLEKSLRDLGFTKTDEWTISSVRLVLGGFEEETLQTKIILEEGKI